jgi:phosphoribosylaminoimidazole-succinocarboxamide synthase
MEGGTGKAGGLMALFESNIGSLPRLGRGKVRDIYGVDGDKLMIVVTDRLSAFDVVLPDPIPDKGRVLNELANFWFAKLAHVVPNHLTGIDPESVVKGEEEKAQVRGRAIVVKKMKPLPIEAVVRGYLIGSGWKDYQASGAGSPSTGSGRAEIPMRSWRGSAHAELVEAWGGVLSRDC